MLFLPKGIFERAAVLWEFFWRWCYLKSMPAFDTEGHRWAAWLQPFPGVQTILCKSIQSGLWKSEILVIVSFLLLGLIMIMVVTKTECMKMELITRVHIFFEAERNIISRESNEGTLYNITMFKKLLPSFSFIGIIACKSSLRLLILSVFSILKESP